MKIQMKIVGGFRTYWCILWNWDLCLTHYNFCAFWELEAYGANLLSILCIFVYFEIERPMLPNYYLFGAFWELEVYVAE